MIYEPIRTSLALRTCHRHIIRKNHTVEKPASYYFFSITSVFQKQSCTSSVISARFLLLWWGDHYLRYRELEVGLSLVDSTGVIFFFLNFTSRTLQGICEAGDIRLEVGVVQNCLPV